MIIESIGCVFIHVPKTGGQSVEQALLSGVSQIDREKAHVLLARNADPRRGPPRLAHLTAEEYLDLGYVDRGRAAEFFKFGFVRNPWSRLVSEFRASGHAGRMQLKTWVHECFPEPGWTDAYRHVIPQRDFFFDEDGHCLVDYIGRFENLERDFSLVARRLGLRVELGHMNPSVVKLRWRFFKALGVSGLARRWMKQLREGRMAGGRDGGKELFDDELIQWVEERYAADILTFGYRFEDQW